MEMNKQVVSGMGLGALLLFILIGAGVYVSSQSEENVEENPITSEEPMPVDNNGDNSVAGGIEPTLFGTRVMFGGEITCLPHKGGPVTTMECAYGLKADNGSYYGLKNLFTEPGPWKFDVGSRVQITGMLEEPGANQTYDIAGVIDVEDAASRGTI